MRNVRTRVETSIDRFDQMRRNLETLNEKTVVVGALEGENAWLAGIHEYGCDITARRAKYLTVPVHREAVGRKANSFTNLFVFTSRRGNKFLARKNGNDDIELMYWLTERVKIPERSFLRAGHDEKAEDVLKNCERALSQVVNGNMSVDEYLDMVGLQLSTAIKTFARDLDSPPNSPITKNNKGSENPLIDTGNMIESISWEIK